MKNILISQLPNLLPCDKGYGQLMQAGSDADLIETYFDNIDFCLAHNFPPNEQIRTISGHIEAGIMVSMKRIVSNPKRLVVLGRSDVEATFDGYSVARLYVKHDSLLIVKAKGNAFVMIDALDRANVHVTCTENARVVVNLYSQAICTGATKIIAKNAETYDLQTR